MKTRDLLGHRVTMKDKYKTGYGRPHYGITLRVLAVYTLPEDEEHDIPAGVWFLYETPDGDLGEIPAYQTRRVS